MDKQIMIDGVDVSGCEHLYREIDCLAHIDFSECCEGYNPSYGYCPNTDCYYKQLKIKEQECEELNNIINEAKNSKLDLKSFLVCEAVQNEYEQQLELKKEECNELKELNTRLDRQREAYWKGYQKLDKALTEIKELAETFDEDDEVRVLLLQKISEVLDENI